MAQKETKMVIKVDLACEKCRKKIKKVLCDIPQVQNQVYDEKENTVTITVVSGNPDEVKKKICCKGGKAVKCIKIVVPPPPRPECCRECCKGVSLCPCWAGCGRPGPCCYCQFIRHDADDDFGFNTKYAPI